MANDSTAPLTTTIREAAHSGINAGKTKTQNSDLRSRTGAPSGGTSGSDTPSTKTVTVGDASSKQPKDLHSNTPQTDQTLEVSEKKEQKDINEMSVSEIEEELNSLNVNEGVLTPEEEARKKALEEAQKASSAPVGGEVKNTGNPDEPEVDDDNKFDIQQGDFIDFLMKEVVLASVAWAGKHTFNAAGYWMLYKPLSYGYHAAEDFIEKRKDAKAAKKDAENKAQAIRDEIRRQYGRDALVPNDIPSSSPYCEDAKKIFNIHNQELKAADTQLANIQRLNEYMAALVAGKEDENIGQSNGKKCWQASDGTLVPLDNPLVQRVTDAFAKARENVLSQNNLTDEQKQSQIEDLANTYGTIMLEKYTQDAQAGLFATDYATAHQLQSLVEGKEPRSREELLQEAKTIFYTSLVAERSGAKGGKSTQLLLKTAKEAKNTAAAQIQNQTSYYNSSLNELNYLASYNPSTGVYTEDRYFSLLTLPNERNAENNYETGLESIENLPKNADYYVLLRAKEISEDDFINTTGLSSQEFAEKHERLAGMIDQQVERIDVVAPHDSSNKQIREDLLKKLRESTEKLSKTEKDAETFALDYCFSQRTSENSKESEAILLAQGRLLYYSTRQKEPEQAKTLSNLGREAAQEAKTPPGTPNTYLQQIQQLAKGKKKSNSDKQSFIDEALSSFETEFEEKRKAAEAGIAGLDHQSAEYIARKKALEKVKKTKAGTTPTNSPTQPPAYRGRY